MNAAHKFYPKMTQFNNTALLPLLFIRHKICTARNLEKKILYNVG